MSVAPRRARVGLRPCSGRCARSCASARCTTNRVERRLARCANVDDLRAAAKKRLPGGVFDYIDGAAEDEVTLGRNAAALRGRVELAPRVLRDVSKVDLSTTLLGRPVPAPLALSPTGFARIADPQGELAVARAAAAARPAVHAVDARPPGASRRSPRSATGRSGSRCTCGGTAGWCATWCERAEAEGYEALMVTVDTAVFGRRERDVRRGFTLPPTIGLGTIVDGIRHPGVDVGVRAGRARSPSPTWPATPPATAAPRSRCPTS